MPLSFFKTDIRIVAINTNDYSGAFGDAAIAPPRLDMAKPCGELSRLRETGGIRGKLTEIAARTTPLAS